MKTSAPRDGYRCRRTMRVHAPFNQRRPLESIAAVHIATFVIAAPPRCAYSRLIFTVVILPFDEVYMLMFMPERHYALCLSRAKTLICRRAMPLRRLLVVVVYAAAEYHVGPGFPLRGTYAEDMLVCTTRVVAAGLRAMPRTQRERCAQRACAMLLRRRALRYGARAPTPPRCEMRAR